MEDLNYEPGSLKTLLSLEGMSYNEELGLSWPSRGKVKGCLPYVQE